MKLFLRSAFALLISFSLYSTSHALLELRGHYGLSVSSSATDGISGLATNPSLPGLMGVGGDVIVSLPLMPFGFGLRWENLGAEVDAGSIPLEASLNRVSGIVNYRLIDTILHLGAIATVGMSHSASMTVGSTKFESSPGFFGTYTLGIEAGVGLIGLLVGAEVGYMSANLGNMEDGAGNKIGTDIDVSGPYAKIMMGFGF